MDESTKTPVVQIVGGALLIGLLAFGVYAATSIGSPHGRLRGACAPCRGRRIMGPW